MLFLHLLRTLKELKAIGSENIFDFYYQVSGPFRGNGSGGARALQGCKCTPILEGQRDKIHFEFCLFLWPMNVVHPLISAPHVAPAFRVKGSLPPKKQSYLPLKLGIQKCCFYFVCFIE